MLGCLTNPGACIASAWADLVALVTTAIWSAHVPLVWAIVAVCLAYALGKWGLVGVGAFVAFGGALWVAFQTSRGVKSDPPPVATSATSATNPKPARPVLFPNLKLPWRR